MTGVGPLLALLLLLSPVPDGWDFLDRGKFPYARTWFTNRLKKSPEDVELMVGLGLAHSGLGDTEKASTVLLEALRRDGGHALARRALAEVFLERARRRIATGRRDEPTRILLLDAADQAQRSVASDPDPIEGWIALANIWFELGEAEKASAAMDEVELRGGGDDRESMLQLRAEFESLEILHQLDTQGPAILEDSVLRLKALIESVPDSVELRLRLGDVLHRHEQWLEALEAYRSALRLDPFRRPCLELLVAYLPFEALCTPAHKILIEADRLARKRASARDPRPGFSRYCLGQAQLILRDWTAAIALFEEARGIDDQLNIPCSVGLGDARFRTGEHDAAATAYLAAIRINIVETVARIQHLGQARLVSANLRFLANRAVDAEELDQGRDLLHAATGLVEHEPALWNDYAFLCRETKDFEAAGEAYLRLTELSPDDPRVLNDTALVLHYHLDRADEARELYQRALKAADRVLADPRAVEAAQENARSARKDARENLRRLEKKSDGARP